MTVCSSSVSGVFFREVQQQLIGRALAPFAAATPQHIDQALVDRFQFRHPPLQLFPVCHQRLRRRHERFVIMTQRFQLLTERGVLCLQLLRHLQERRLLRSQLVVELEGLLEMGGELRDVHDADILHTRVAEEQRRAEEIMMIASARLMHAVNLSSARELLGHGQTCCCQCLGGSGVDT